ncbi:MAG TPA: TetR/AcrR family transcriptional regulator C-terminal domain-containing protein [Microbacterium sp.]|nr:TetR/AcrR family transcriptional regulator C-terminal domain-containing protein [Microbacterium sp.]
MASTKRPSARTRLNRERVLQAAVAFADEHGIGSLSMRKLGDALGVEAMSLYNHVANKTELLDCMIDLVFSEIELPTMEGSWQASMRLRAISIRQVLSRRRWAIGLMETRTSPGPATLRHQEAVLACLRNAGFSLQMAARASSVLDSYIYGFALQEAALPFRTAEETDDISRALLEQMPPDKFPRLTELTLEHILQPTYDPDGEYEFGLDLILNSLERSREAPGRV